MKYKIHSISNGYIFCDISDDNDNLIIGNYMHQIPPNFDDSQIEPEFVDSIYPAIEQMTAQPIVSDKINIDASPVLVAMENAKESMKWDMTKYNVLNKNSVQKFLSNNPDILNTINDIYDKINQYFIEIQKISLEVFNDVETNNESLLIRVLTTLGVESACKYLDKFDEDYFAEKFIELNSRVNITLDF